MDKMHYCNLCEKSFFDTSKLKHYEVVHQKIKTCFCNKCGKSFNQAGALKIYDEAVHQKKKKYFCNTCGKAFARADSVTKHENVIHKGVNKGRSHAYKCDLCGKQFSSTNNLKTHNEGVHEDTTTSFAVYVERVLIEKTALKSIMKLSIQGRNIIASHVERILLKELTCEGIIRLSTNVSRHITPGKNKIIYLSYHNFSYGLFMVYITKHLFMYLQPY